MANANQIQLHQAISTGNVAALNQTIRRMGAFRDGTNVNLAFDMHREAPQTPLYYAIKYNKPQIVEALIKAGAKVNQVDSEGNTPLYYAIKNKCYDIMETLVKKGANLELTNDTGESARTLAAVAGFKFSDNQPDTRFSRFMKSFLSAFIYNFFASIGLLSAVAPNTIEAASVKNHTSTDETTGAILSVLASKNDGRPVEKNQPFTSKEIVLFLDFEIN